MIGIHPDDPPIAHLGGVARIFSTFENYKRALADRRQPECRRLPLHRLLAGGRRPVGRRRLIEAIRYFGEQQKLFKVHFRNVNAPLPHFVETFVDDGYRDMSGDDGDPAGGRLPRQSPSPTTSRTWPTTCASARPSPSAT